MLSRQAQVIDVFFMVQVAKGAKDSLTEVIRSGDLIAYTAEEGVRYLGEVRSCLQIEHDPNMFK